MEIQISKKKYYVFHRKHKRTYRNLLSGINKAFLQDLTVRFITLTTSNECVNQPNFNQSTLARDFIKFYQKTKRLTPKKLHQNEYMSKHKTSYHYGKNNFNNKIFSDISYFKIHTSEGNGVIHAVFCSPYIPAEYIRDSWFDIHLSHQVNIQYIKPADVNKVSSYIVSQYIANQGDAYLYSSQSKNWLFSGANHYWNDLKYVHLRDNDQWVLSQFTYDSTESLVCKNPLISKSYRKTVNRWINPPITSEIDPNQFEKQFQVVKQKWNTAIEQSIQETNFSYQHKPTIKYFISEKPVGPDYYHQFAHGKQMAFPFYKYPVYDFPPVFKKKTILTAADEKRLSSELLNTLYRDSRLNPLACISKHIDQKYHPFVEKKLSHLEFRKNKRANNSKISSFPLSSGGK